MLKEKTLEQVRHELNELKLLQSRTIANAVSNIYDKRTRDVGFAGFRSKWLQGGGLITNKVKMDGKLMADRAPPLQLTKDFSEESEP